MKKIVALLVIAPWLEHSLHIPYMKSSTLAFDQAAGDADVDVARAATVTERGSGSLGEVN